MFFHFEESLNADQRSTLQDIIEASNAVAPETHAQLHISEYSSCTLVVITGNSRTAVASIKQELDNMGFTLSQYPGEPNINTARSTVCPLENEHE